MKRLVHVIFKRFFRTYVEYRAREVVIQTTFCGMVVYHEVVPLPFVQEASFWELLNLIDTKEFEAG